MAARSRSRVTADAGLINCCAGIDIRATVKKQRDRGEVAVFCAHMQERSSLKQEVAPAGLAAIELGETLVHECGISVNQLSQTIEPAADQLQHGWRVVLGRGDLMLTGGLLPFPRTGCALYATPA